MDTLFEVGVIFLLLLANGIFAMAEIAVVSSKKSKLKSLAESGDARAKRALALAENPNRFLATVQVGITLVGIIAGAYGGAALSEKLAVPMRAVPGIAAHANMIAFVIVVAFITYFSLVIGELVPKRLGLSNPEKVAGLLAGPMASVSYFAKPLISLLSNSTEGLLRLCGFKDLPEATVTEEELRLLAKEGLRVGVLHPAETKMVESVLELDRLHVDDIMTPRSKIIWVQENEPHERLWHKIVISGHTTFPVYSSTRDRAIGVISVKSIYANLAAGAPVKVRDLMTDPLTVPVTQNGLTLLEAFKKTGRHVAIVVDEFGSVTGMATMHDIMEAIVGEFPSLKDRLRPVAKQRDDGSWLVDAMIPIEEFRERVPTFELTRGGAIDYETFGGFILKALGHIPTEGETFSCGPYVVEIIDMDLHRVDKVLLFPAKSALTGERTTSQKEDQ